MHIDIFQYCYFLRTMLQVMASLILTLLFACSETVHNNNQEDHTTLMSANDVGGDSIGQQIDPLFFLPGQLCQHVRRIYQDQQDNLWMGTNVSISCATMAIPFNILEKKAILTVEE